MLVPTLNSTISHQIKQYFDKSTAEPKYRKSGQGVDCRTPGPETGG